VTTWGDTRSSCKIRSKAHGVRKSEANRDQGSHLVNWVREGLKRKLN
jgi:hypothetical protein